MVPLIDEEEESTNFDASGSGLAMQASHHLTQLNQIPIACTWLVIVTNKYNTDDVQVGNRSKSGNKETGEQLDMVNNMKPSTSR